MTEADKIKIALLKKLKKEIKENYIAVPEVTLSKNIADILVTNGDIHIFEIKSKSDSLTRLEKQIHTFKRYANRVTVIADSKFIEKLQTFPYMADVGIIEVDARGRLTEIVESTSNQIASADYFEYWSPFELKETLRSFPKWYTYDSDKSKEVLLQTLTKDELRRLTIFRIKQKFMPEFEQRQNYLKEGNLKKALNSRYENLERLSVTPLLWLKASVLRDFF